MALTLGPTVGPVSENLIVAGFVLAPASVVWHAPLGPTASAARSARSPETLATETLSSGAVPTGPHRLPPFDDRTAPTAGRVRIGCHPLTSKASAIRSSGQAG